MDVLQNAEKNITFSDFIRIVYLNLGCYISGQHIYLGHLQEKNLNNLLIHSQGNKYTMLYILELFQENLFVKSIRNRVNRGVLYI